MLTVIAVTYNSLKFLPAFMESLYNQTYFKSAGSLPEIFIVDNASTDGTVKFIKEHYPNVRLLRNIKNVGLPRAWNQALRLSHQKFALITNPDVILDKDFIKLTMQAMAADNNLSCVGGKLYRLKTAGYREENSLFDFEKTNYLDSCGLLAYKSRRFIDRGGGEIDRGQYDQAEEVFGISGACVLYRRRALEAVKYEEQYFDEDFFIYQEDIDLAWRLRLAGWSALYLPSARGYHHRRARVFTRHNWYNVLKYRRQKDAFVNFYSYRNHLFLLYKNSLPVNFLLHLPFILFYELKKFIYVLILENSTWRRAWRDCFKFFKVMRRKRRVNMRLKRVSSAEMRTWFK